MDLLANSAVHYLKKYTLGNIVHHDEWLGCDSSPSGTLVSDVEGLLPFGAVDIPVRDGLCPIESRARCQQ